MYNPDYPTHSGSFLQHTYQPAMSALANDYHYYGGGPINPFGNQPQLDSRRNNGYPTNPMTPYGAPNMVQPESQVVPFGSYPPATPNPQTPGMPAFNALVDSRRNNPIANNQSNPWAQSNNQTPTLPTSNPMMNNNPYGSMYSGVSYGFNGMYPIEMSASALYTENNFGFDKRNGCWDNMYTANRTIAPPVIDWKAKTNNNSYACYQQNPYGTAQYPKMDMNWKEIAERNWGSSNL